MAEFIEVLRKHLIFRWIYKVMKHRISQTCQRVVWAEQVFSNPKQHDIENANDLLKLFVVKFMGLPLPMYLRV